MDHNLTLLITACLFGFIMSWGIGANDVANIMGTSVGSKAITIKQAILIAAIFEFAGAFLAGGQVTDTIRSKIIDTSMLAMDPDILVYGMMSSLLAAGLWLGFASHYGLPVSTTHSIIGAILGFGVIAVGTDSIYWGQVLRIILSWFVTPFIAGVFANLVFRSIQHFIMHANDPLSRAKRILPFYVFIVAIIVCLVTLTKGLKHLGLDLSLTQTVMIILTISVLVVLISRILIRRITPTKTQAIKYDYESVEKAFATLMIFTASAMAFAHGSNDVANAIGPLSAIVDVIQSGGQIHQHVQIPNWVLYLGATGIVLGLATYGYRVMQTIGVNITDLTPTRGFAAEFSTATTVLVASALGLPVSTTQTLVGAILGIGLARGFGALNLQVVRNIVLSWLITLPTGAGLSVLIFYALRYVF